MSYPVWYISISLQLFFNSPKSSLMMTPSDSVKLCSKCPNFLWAGKRWETYLATKRVISYGKGRMTQRGEPKASENHFLGTRLCPIQVTDNTYPTRVKNCNEQWLLCAHHSILFFFVMGGFTVVILCLFLHFMLGMYV